MRTYDKPDVNAFEVRDIGIPVRSVRWVRIFAGVDAQGQECLYATMGQSANLFVLQIDLSTGKTAKFSSSVPNTHNPPAAILTQDGHLYIGATPGHLLCFDPAKGEMEDLGAINPPDTFPCRISEGPDGLLWIGCYGTASLTSYDPKTHTFTRYGRMDDVGTYCYPQVTPDGFVACVITVEKACVVVLDPKTGDRRTVGPVITAEEWEEKKYVEISPDRSFPGCRWGVGEMPWGVSENGPVLI